MLRARCVGISCRAVKSGCQRIRYRAQPGAALPRPTHRAICGGGAGQRSGFDGAETTVLIAQPIELARKRAKRMTLAALEEELAQWDYQSKRLDIARRVSGAFVNVLGAQERLALSEELVRISEQAHIAVTQRVAAGRDSPIEQTKSGVALSTMRIELQRAERALESARKGLAAAWGSRTAGFSEVAGQFDEVRPVPSVDKLSALVQQNPDIARWAVEKQRRRAALKLEKAKAISNVTLNGGLRQFNETDDSAAVLGLSIPLPLSDRNQGGLREATYLLAKTEDSRKAAEIEVLAALEAAALRLAGALAEATALKNIPAPSEEEAAMLAFAPGLEANSRLGCQIKLNETLDGIVVRLPEEVDSQFL